MAKIARSESLLLRPLASPQARHLLHESAMRAAPRAGPLKPHQFQDPVYNRYYVLRLFRETPSTRQELIRVSVQLNRHRYWQIR